MVWLFYEVTNSVLNRSCFDCGISELNDYLQRYAGQNHKKGVAKTWVMVNQDRPEVPVGYYSISMADLQQMSLSPEEKKAFKKNIVIWKIY